MLVLLALFQDEIARRRLRRSPGKPLGAVGWSRGLQIDTLGFFAEFEEMREHILALKRVPALRLLVDRWLGLDQRNIQP
jgi:hypothetical protein